MLLNIFSSSHTSVFSRKCEWNARTVEPWSAGGVNVVLQAVIMDSFMSDVKKKKLKQNWRDAPVIEHARNSVTYFLFCAFFFFCKKKLLRVFITTNKKLL